MANAERIVCWFSCGAASAVATKLAITENAGKLPIVVAYTEVRQEHSDSQRFLRDCEEWFGTEITILRNETYNADIYEVFRRTQYLVGPKGAACTRLLKKEVRKGFERPTDRQVFGFTMEESDRADRFMDANNGVDLWTPLIERSLTKADCLGIIDKAGIALHRMYQLGYHNANCIGCVKGGMGYWNKLRTDFPLVFEEMAQVEEELGRTICHKEEKVDGKRVRIPITLRQLKPTDGHYPTEQGVECGVACLLTERELTHA